MASEILKHDTQTLIDNSSNRLSFANNAGKSEVLKQFMLISIVSGAHLCSSGSRDGISGLKANGVLSNQMSTGKITAFTKPAENPKVPAKVKSDVADIVVQMCAKDIRLFFMIEGIGFKVMAEKLISNGAKYGNVEWM